MIYEDNTACLAQLIKGYIKRDRSKHISPKFVYTHEFQQSKKINIKQIRSTSNLADIFIKDLPTSTFKKIIFGIDMCRFNKLLD